MLRGIYLIDADNSLIEMREQGYDSEALLQQLLADHPGILAGENGDGATPMRWLLVSREAAIPDAMDGPGRWFIDHVFLDQDAVPTLVEVKRSSDTRIRREVVGQMLDYAANASAYWPPERLRSVFETRCAARGIDPLAELLAVSGADTDPDAFWERAKTNLQAGKLRLVFVADEIPPELRRVIEFLNEQMDPAEVIAIEVRQYVGGGLRTLVPSIIGQTAEAQQRKSVRGPTGAQWDEDRFMAGLRERVGEEAVLVASSILEWANRTATRVWWGKGERSGGFVPVVAHNGTDHQLFAVYTYGSLEVYFQYYAGKPPFDNEENRRELLRRLNAVRGVAIPEDALRRRPSISLASVAREGTVQELLRVFEWFIEEVRRTT